MSDNRTPDWNPRDDSILDDPLPTYDRMRRECPVAWSPFQHWSLFRHSDVMQVLHEPETFSNAVSQHLSVPNGMDPPEHGRYRAVIEPYFSPDAMARFEPRCREIARELVQSLPQAGSIDVIPAFAEDFALRIQCAFMGWRCDLHEPLREWLHRNQTATLAGDRDAMAQVAVDFDSTIRSLLAERRATSNDAPEDTTTALMRETVNGRALTDEELVSILRNWTVGELGTISASVGIVLNTLARNPQLRNRLAEAPENLGKTIDEILRRDAPLMSNRRVTTCPVTLGGRRIEAGERLTLLWASANRDETVFGDPEALNPDANADQNLLYGAGIHVCPGAPLARLELNTLFEELLYWRPQFEPEGTAKRARYPAGGFARLPLRFSAGPETE
ncbi:cytochrome P450 [Halovibrio salipaludis]|uniref:Cytochrome P450 n=1 Tax=Halovibrio salipaludis TaxID=2032626 RepID=A0A2A2FC97_9GAMM|nr:cytochrome P450 [Halovibrio salipaludis]PAU82173.1 cytochrome P450 [Halovibrio salipaludis]